MDKINYLITILQYPFMISAIGISALLGLRYSDKLFNHYFPEEDI